MDIENQEDIYCADDGEYRIYCDIFVNFCIKRLFKNPLKSKTHTNKIRRREQLNK